MNQEATFRIVLAVGFLAVLAITLYHRLRSWASKEKLDRRQEGLFILATLRPVGFLLWLGVIVYLVHPAWMTWSSVPLPAGLRWAGVGLAALGLGLLTWTLRGLGTNLTSRTEEANLLARFGEPYRAYQQSTGRLCRGYATEGSEDAGDANPKSSPAEGNGTLGSGVKDMIGEMPMPWRVFYSYSHRDAKLRNRLATYLAPLRQQKKIVEWHDRQIEPGADWESEISDQLDSAHLILLLVSEDFLASEYSFGVEVERALTRLKRSEVRVVPVLLKPCLWQESRFSELQIIPRDGKAITSWTSQEKAFVEVATEIRKLVSAPPPSTQTPTEPSYRFAASLDLVRGQVRSYARLYERTRQRMPPSDTRTARMEQIFKQMRALATASYPLLDELANSPSPGERLAAVAILQVFASEESLPFLVRLVGSEKPFVGYHATRALHFAVSALDAHVHPQLLDALQKARVVLDSAEVGADSDRQTVLREALRELQATMKSLAAPSDKYD